MTVAPATAAGELPELDPLVALVAAVVLAMALALVRMLRELEPESLTYLRRATGVGPVVRGALALALAVSLASVVAFGGRSIGRADPVFLGALVVHLLGLWLLGLGVASAPDYVRARLASRADAHGVEPGQRVALSGTAAVAEGTVETPATGTEALCYEARAMEYRGDDPEGAGTEPNGLGSGWVPTSLDGDRVPFAVDDGTGRALVDPGDADLELDETAVPTSDGPGVGQDVEAPLQPGDAVTVVGSAIRDEGSGSTRVAASLVASGDLAALERDLHRETLRTGAEGLLLALGGYAGMLVAAGAV